MAIMIFRPVSNSSHHSLVALAVSTKPNKPTKHCQLKMVLTCLKWRSRLDFPNFMENWYEFHYLYFSHTYKIFVVQIFVKYILTLLEVKEFDMEFLTLITLIKEV